MARKVQVFGLLRSIPLRKPTYSYTGIKRGGRLGKRTCFAVNETCGPASKPMRSDRDRKAPLIFAGKMGKKTRWKKRGKRGQPSFNRRVDRRRAERASNRSIRPANPLDTPVQPRTPERVLPSLPPVSRNIACRSCRSRGWARGSLRMRESGLVYCDHVEWVDEVRYYDVERLPVHVGRSAPRPVRARGHELALPGRRGTVVPARTRPAVSRGGGRTVGQASRGRGLSAESIARIRALARDSDS